MTGGHDHVTSRYGDESTAGPLALDGPPPTWVEVDAAREGDSRNAARTHDAAPSSGIPAARARSLSTTIDGPPSRCFCAFHAPVIVERRPVLRWPFPASPRWHSLETTSLALFPLNLPLLAASFSCGSEMESERERLQEKAKARVRAGERERE